MCEVDLRGCWLVGLPLNSFWDSFLTFGSSCRSLPRHFQLSIVNDSSSSPSMRILLLQSQQLRPLCRKCYKHIRYLSTQLTLTDPLAIYQNLVESSILKPDEAQFRAAVELQKLSKRLQDYTPPETFSRRIQELSDLLAKVHKHAILDLDLTNSLCRNQDVWKCLGIHRLVVL